jgi:hypothetical protein
MKGIAMKIKDVKMIELAEWDDIVTKTYGRPYSFQQQDGCKDRGIFHLSIPDEPCDFENDTVPEIVNGEKMGVSVNAWLARDPIKPIENQKYDFELTFWWERNFYPDIQMVANDLLARGLIEAGDYSIEIDW